jgi:hypothetical protein
MGALSHLNSAVFQKLCNRPACLLSEVLPLWVIRPAVSSKAACALLSMSGSDRCAFTRCPSNAAALRHNSEVVSRPARADLLRGCALRWAAADVTWIA